MTSSDRIDAPEDIRLAIGYVDYYALARGLVFILGIPLGFLIFAHLGKANAFAGYLVAMLSWIPVAAVVGLVLSLIDAMQVWRHRNACADIERSRRRASRHLFSISLQQAFWQASRRHRRELLPASLVYFLPVVAFTLLGRFFGAVWLLAVVFGTELLCWRLVWRPRLLERAAALEATPPSANHKPESS